MASVSDKPMLEPIAYDPNDLPSLSPAGRLSGIGGGQESSVYAKPIDNHGLAQKGPLLKSVSDYLDKSSR
jgi:hypothetical protein